MRHAVAFAGLFLAVLAARCCHLRILWIEECYPAAGAIQMLHGLVPYRDFWFDKPPLSSAVYLLWGAWDGWPLRIAGALFVTLVCWLLYRCAREQWGEREGWIAAALGAFFLTFYVPSAVVALAPDLLLMAPHVAAVWLAWRGRAFWAGVLSGVALLVHTKGIYVLAACLIWQFRSAPQLIFGFLLPNAAAVAWLGAAGALPAYWRQVWEWGVVYARDTFVETPFAEGWKRTLNWAGFHAAPLLAALWYWWRERDSHARRMALWAAISLLGVAGGARFFPRYYFQLLPVVLLAGASGFALLGRRRGAALSLLLLVPLLRFGPRYVTLGADLIAGRPHEWNDLALYQESVEAARVLKRIARPGDTLLVWGYRPDLFVLTRLRAGAPFLDSQPLTGVIADRHLTVASPSAPDLAARSRRRLASTNPSLVIDVLGTYNPALAITSYPDLRPWLAEYVAVPSAGAFTVFATKQEH